MVIAPRLVQDHLFMPMSQKEYIEQLTESIYLFLETYIRRKGFSPNLREIAKNCHIGRSTTMRYLDRLEAQGRIAREPGYARSIRLLIPPQK